MLTACALPFVLASRHQRELDDPQAAVTLKHRREADVAATAQGLVELLVAAIETQGGDEGASGEVMAVCLRSSLTAAFERHVQAAATEAADASGGFCGNSLVPKTGSP